MVFSAVVSSEPRRGPGVSLFKLLLQLSLENWLSTAYIASSSFSILTTIICCCVIMKDQFLYFFEESCLAERTRSLT